MKGKLALIGVLLAGISFSADKLIIKKPPESLSKYYPPKSKKFEFVSNMHKMSLAFYAVNLNINAENWEKAKEWARNLEKTYKETAKMVPEWKKYFKPELAENFRKAVESQNVDEVIKTSKKLGRNCQKCHQDNMAIVKIMYRFPSFEKIKIEDPIEFTELETGKYMRKLVNSMKALRILLLQGDTENARQAGEEFIERARQLKTMCTKCHTEEEKEVIKASMKKSSEALDIIAEAISAENIDRNKIFNSLNTIGMSCSKCHNVHEIPALIQEAFEE